MTPFLVDKVQTGFIECKQDNIRMTLHNIGHIKVNILSYAENESDNSFEQLWEKNGFHEKYMRGIKIPKPE